MEREVHELGFMQSVVDAYVREDSSVCGSLRGVALEFGITRTKVRKILITLGAISSPLPEEAIHLQSSGMKLQEISVRLGIPISTLSTYLPYVTVMYNGEERSANALRIGIFRDRLSNIARMHHHSMSSVDSRKFEEKFDSQINTPPQEEPMLKSNEIPVMRLRLELSLDGLDAEDFEVLRRYCDVKEGYSREILAPSDMTLHGLHYAIMQLFGWLNGHLRRFSLPEEVLNEMTSGRLDDYLDLVGVYFRMPFDPSDADSFWDDHFDGGSSFKSWLRKRYTSPFVFLGRSEQFMAARTAAEALRGKVRRGKLHKILEERRQENEYVKLLFNGSKDIMLEELSSITDFTYGDLLERLKLSEIIGAGKVVPKEIDQLRQKSKDHYEYNLKRSVGSKMPMAGMLPLTPVVQPITDTLNYEFDFGDGWQIKITCCETYTVGKFDEIGPDMSEKIRGVMKTGRPLCIAMDGSRQLVQDVGGIYGYCDFLRTINGDDPQAKQEMKEWASELSWTGRKASPEKLL